MSKPRRAGLPEKSCLECKYLRSRSFADGTSLYFCAKKPGLCVGEISPVGIWFHEACEEFERSPDYGQT